MIELHVKNDLTEPKVVTPDHLVWAKVDAGSEWRWTKACDLQEGSFLLDGGDETTVVRPPNATLSEEKLMSMFASLFGGREEPKRLDVREVLQKLQAAKSRRKAAASDPEFVVGETVFFHEHAPVPEEVKLTPMTIFHVPPKRVVDVKRRKLVDVLLEVVDGDGDFQLVTASVDQIERYAGDEEALEERRRARDADRKARSEAQEAERGKARQAAMLAQMKADTRATLEGIRDAVAASRLSSHPEVREAANLMSKAVDAVLAVNDRATESDQITGTVQ